MTRDFKSPELCFLEIANEVLRRKNKRVDNGERVESSSITYSKMKNQDTTYVYEGNVPITGDITLCYYLSHKRSCISLQLQKENSVIDNKMLQIHLLRYVQTLFCYHRIDAFVYGLSK